jgi:hypothetical protein
MKPKIVLPKPGLMNHHGWNFGQTKVVVKQHSIV